jgi:hypothetical protein
MTLFLNVQELLTTPPAADWTVDDWVEGLLQIAARSHELSLQMIRSDGVKAIGVTQDKQSMLLADSNAIRVLRPVLAGLAQTAARESGDEFNPYGGRCSFTREVDQAAVRINVEFENTTQTQRITFVTAKAPLSDNGEAH